MGIIWTKPTPAQVKESRRSAMTPPTTEQIKQARMGAGLTQTAAATLIYSTLSTWQDWEGGKYKMHQAFYELFLLKTTKQES